AQLGVYLFEYSVVVNLAPADLRKAGSGFDLAIAAATLAALRVVPHEALEGVLFLGELSLDGSVHALRVALAQLLGARARRLQRAVVPRAREGEAGLVSAMDVRTVATLGELLSALRGEIALPRAVASVNAAPSDAPEDLRDVHGQASARRALEIAAAGGHCL